MLNTVSLGNGIGTWLKFRNTKQYSTVKTFWKQIKILFLEN